MDWGSDKSGLFYLVLDTFISFNTGTSHTNTDQLSASLKTDKTGVWHWNSSQRLKDPFCLPPQSSWLWLDSKRWLMLSAFKHRGALLANERTNKQTCKCTKDTDIKTRCLQGVKWAERVKKERSEVIRRCGRFIGWWICQRLIRNAVYTSCLSYKLFIFQRSSLMLGEIRFLVGLDRKTDTTLMSVW